MTDEMLLSALEALVMDTPRTSPNGSRVPLPDTLSSSASSLGLGDDYHDDDRDDDDDDRDDRETINGRGSGSGSGSGSTGSGGRGGGFILGNAVSEDELSIAEEDMVWLLLPLCFAAVCVCLLVCLMVPRSVGDHASHACLPRRHPPPLLPPHSTC